MKSDQGRAPSSDATNPDHLNSPRNWPAQARTRQHPSPRRKVHSRIFSVALGENPRGSEYVLRSSMQRTEGVGFRASFTSMNVAGFGRRFDSFLQIHWYRWSSGGIEYRSLPRRRLDLKRASPTVSHRRGWSERLFLVCPGPARWVTHKWHRCQNPSGPVQDSLVGNVFDPACCGSQPRSQSALASSRAQRSTSTRTRQEVGGPLGCIFDSYI